MLQQGLVVWSFSLVRDHSVVRTAAERLTPSLLYKFRMAKKAPTRRQPELAPDFPSTAASVYENRSGEADAKLAELWKKRNHVKRWLTRRRHGE
jgi:hypothetical protein